MEGKEIGCYLQLCFLPGLISPMRSLHRCKDFTDIHDRCFLISFKVSLASRIPNGLNVLSCIAL